MIGLEQAQAEAGYVVPLTVGSTLLAIFTVGALLVAYVAVVWVGEWLRDAEGREVRRRERARAGAARALAEAAHDITERTP